MKKLLSIFVFTLLTSLLAAQISKTVNVTTAGSLTTLLTSTEKTTVTNLTVTGNIDVRDVKCMRDEISGLEILDISTVNILAYNGNGGTSSTTTIYPANSMPELSFCYNSSGSGKTTLKTVYLPDLINSFGDQTFRGCYNLTNITIPNAVTIIGNNTFDGCSRLTSISIPNSVTIIGNMAFAWCSGLANITIGNSVTTIGNWAFGYCGLTSVTIPSSVKTIGNSAFSNCKKITNITIPNNVISIGSYAFQSCSLLSSVIIGNSVQTIGDNAFDNCRGLTCLTIGNSVTSIGNYAFSYCVELKIIKSLNNTPPLLGSGCFTSVLPSAVYVSSTAISNYKIASGWSEFIGVIKDDNTANTCDIIVQIGFNGIVKENNLILQNGSLVNAYIGTTKTFIIEPNVGYEISTVSYNGVDVKLQLNNNQFTTPAINANSTINITFQIDNKPVLKTINVTTAGSLNSLLSVAEKITITDLTLKGNLDARDIKYLRDSLLRLAFIDMSATKIQSYLGSEGTFTSTFYPENEIPEYSFFNESTNEGKYSLKTIILPASINSIGTSAFQKCMNLTGSLIIPNFVTTIGSRAFVQCYGLTSITIPDYVTSIGDGAFGSCRALLGVTIPNSLSSIGKDVFIECFSLVSVTIPNSVKSIGYGAFWNCKSLTSVTIGNSVNSIGDYAFWNCRLLTGTLTIPNSVTSIGANSFNSCMGLTSIVIPNSVTSIGDYAFAWCSGLNSIYSYPKIPIDLNLISDILLDIDKTTCILYVPKGSKTDYQIASQWKDFVNIIEMTTTNINNPSKSKKDVKVYSSNSSIFIEGTSNGETVTLYTVNGRQIQTVMSKGERLNLPVDRDAVYLVKTGEKTFKVIL